MADEIRTYLVGRRNQTVACDISLPESEITVSRKHLELTMTAAGRCYIVHVHPQNTTKVKGRDGEWVPISQDYVELDAPLMLGSYRTTARELLGRLSGEGLPPPPPVEVQGDGRMEWDPERGTFMRRRGERD
ncbi:MAG: FHA domain-containing protein [Verrucomicrobia bacterium]|nr:FHA domain-containing protein [Verrucomicrobiota bacterium]